MHRRVNLESIRVSRHYIFIHSIHISLIQLSNQFTRTLILQHLAIRITYLLRKIM